MKLEEERKKERDRSADDARQNLPSGKTKNVHWDIDDEEKKKLHKQLKRRPPNAHLYDIRRLVQIWFDE